MQRFLSILLAATTVGVLTYCDIMADEGSPPAAGDEHGRIITGVGLNSDAGVIGGFRLRNQPAPPPPPVPASARQIHFDVLLLRLDWTKLKANDIELSQLVVPPGAPEEFAPETKPPVIVRTVDPGHAKRVVSQLLERKCAERISEPKLVTVEDRMVQMEVSPAPVEMTGFILEETMNGEIRRHVNTAHAGESVCLTPSIMSDNQLSVALDVRSTRLKPPPAGAQLPDEVITRAFNLKATLDDGQTVIVADWPSRDALARGTKYGMMLLVTPKILPTAADSPVDSASAPLHLHALRHDRSTDDRWPARIELRERATRVLPLTGERLVKVDGFDPAIIHVTALSDHEIRVQALQKGFTSLVLVLEGERRPVTMEVFVSGDTRTLEAHLQRLYPAMKVSAIEVQDAVVLRGQVESPAQVDGIVEIAEQFYPRVINQIRVAEPEEMLARSASPTAAGQQPPRPLVQFEVSMWRGVDRKGLRDAGITPEMMRPVHHSAGDSNAGRAGLVGHIIQPEWARHVRDRLPSSPRVSRIFAPKMTTPDGTTGHIIDRTEIPTAVIQEIINGTPSERIDQIRLGTALDLTPFVLEGDQIRLGIVLEHSRLLESGTTADSQPRQIETRRWDAESIVASGSVLLLAEPGLFDPATKTTPVNSARSTDDDPSNGLLLMIEPTVLPADAQAAATNAQPPSVPPPLPRALSATPAYYPVAPLGRRTELSHRAANLREAARKLRDAGLHDMAAQVTKQAEEAEREVRRSIEAAAAQASATRADEPADGLRREIRELRGEVQELRQDVGRLIELLEKRAAAESTDSGSSSHADKAELGRLVEEFNKLFQAKRYAEAEVIAKQALELDRDNPTTEVLFWKARYARHIEPNRVMPGNAVSEPFALGAGLERQRIEAELNRTLDRFDELFAQKRYAEAANLVAEAKQIAPQHPLSQTLRLKAARARRLAGESIPQDPLAASTPAAPERRAGDIGSAIRPPAPAEEAALPDAIVPLPTRALKAAPDLAEAEALYRQLSEAYQQYDRTALKQKIALERWRRLSSVLEAYASAGSTKAPEPIETRKASREYFEARKASEEALANIQATESRLRRLLGMPNDGTLLRPSDESPAPPETSGGIRGVAPRPDERLAHVQVTGQQALTRADVLGQIKTRPGDAPSEERIREDVRRLYGTGWFASVEPLLERGPDGLVLMLDVSESPVAEVLVRLRKLAIEGAPQNDRLPSAPQPPGIDLQGASAEQQIQHRLGQPITLSFDRTPLSDAAKNIAAQTHINVVIDKTGLEEEGVMPDVAVSLNVKDVTLATALKLLLDPLDLGYRIEDEVLKITSRQRSHGALEVRNYLVADFVFADAPEDAKSKALERLIEVISGTVEPDSWAEVGGPGSIRPYLATVSLVVRQTSDVHEEIADLLGQLRQIIQGAQPEPPAGRDNKPDEFCVHTYAVAELVSAGPAADRVDFVELTREIQQKIAPDQWDVHGGQGSIQPWESTNLVIRQTPEIHREISELLNQMRREKSGRN